MAEDDDRAREWSEAQPTVADDAVPLPVEPPTPRPEVTGRHSTMTPAQFASAVEMSENDGYTRGFQHGHEKGLAEGRADVQASDRAEALDDFEAALRLELFEGGIEHGDHFAAKVRKRVKRGG